MRYVLDACIAVAALKPSEPNHGDALRCVAQLRRGVHSLVVPSLFPAEVSAALTRSGVPGALVEAFVEELLASAELLTIGPVRARQIASVTRRTSLRAGDAAYVWVAEREHLPLVTWDAEIASRAASGWPGGSPVASPPGGWSA